MAFVSNEFNKHWTGIATIHAEIMIRQNRNAHTYTNHIKPTTKTNPTHTQSPSNT